MGRFSDLSVVGESKGGGQKGVAGVDADLHGVLGINELEKQVQELPFICRRCHDVPVSRFKQTDLYYQQL